MLSRAEFDRCLLSWIQALHEATDGQVIVIDGKTLRGSFDKASNKSAIHMISAWASANSISLGQSPTVPVRQRHSTNTGHGRRESRWHYVCGVPRDLPDRDRWPGLKAIGMVISNTERDGKECGSIRYYIMTRKMPVKKFAAIVKGHWAIENELHWQLDVTFREDHCRIRKGNADANFSILCRISLMLLTNEKTAKLGVKNKRLSAGWDEDYLLKVLVGS